MSATEKEVLTVPESPPSQNAESSISADITTPSKQMPQNSYSPDNLDNTSLSISIDNSIAVSIFDVELPDVDQNARLDWSGKGLKALPSQKCTELCSSDRQIIALKISRNSLRSLDCTSLPLGKCVELDASQNEISQLRPLHPVAPTLIHLSLSDNRINSLVTLNKFTQLRHLDLSHNRIEHFPVLDQLCQLVSLNLSSNHLKAIPNLYDLTSLAELSLHGNSIRSLETIHAFLPFRSLRFLDLGGNLLADLTHLHFLHGFPELESLTILGNICTSPMGRTFSYRPFVFSCVLAQLSVLDGSCLSEQEILKGEWLHAQGRARSFRPCTGMDAQLCAYLDQECPLVSAELQLIGDERMTKVIRKRREYNNRPDDGRDIKSASSSTASLKQSTDSQTQLLNGTALSTSPTQTTTTTATTPQQLNQTQPKSKAKSTTSATNTQSSSGTPVNSGGRQPPTTSRFSRAAQQQQKGALTPAGTAAIRRAFAGNSPVSAVINARRRHQPQQQQQLPLRDGLQMPSANVDTATISTSSTASSSSPRSSSTVILSRSEAQPISTTTNGFGQNSAPKRSTDTKGRQQPLSLDNASSAQSPLTSRIPTATSCSSSSALPNSCKRSILLHQSRTRSKAFEKTDGGSTTALLDFTMEEGNGNGDGSRIPVKKKSGGIRSVLSRKLRRSGVNQPPSAVTSTELRIQSLQKRVDQLGGQNSMLTAINEDHVRTFQQLTVKVQQLGLELANQAKMQRTLCDLLVPTPVNLVYERRDNDVLVSWENTLPLLNTLVDYYDVSLNNQPTGRVMARQKRLQITDLNPEEELEVSLQAHVSKLNNARSVPSKLLLLSNSSGQWAEKSGKEEEQAKEEEGKENRSTEVSANT